MKLTALETNPSSVSPPSIPGSEIFLSSSELESNFENYLFFVETDTGGSSEFKLPIEFEQGILLRHKVSNKYLSYSTEFEDGESDTTVKL
jgi:hypothetical protein